MYFVHTDRPAIKSGKKLLINLSLDNPFTSENSMSNMFGKHYSNYESPTVYNNIFCYPSWVKCS